MTTSVPATERHVLDGVRVLDCTDGIAGPYCTKLLADAGADVVKVEPDGGDPLRARGSGALFEFLNASKRSVTREDGLAERADIIVRNDGTDNRRRRTNEAAVSVTITPFGRTGPQADRPWNEFTLQAACGSIGQRGLPERPPLAAGGRIGEWAAGTFAAVAALAAFRDARRSGRGEDVDVAMLDCMAVTMVTYPSVYASFLGWPPLSGTGRTVEVPSIEPTSDGYFVVTTNSAQQFQDFLVMIERPDLLDDHELSQVARRFGRRDEFLHRGPPSHDEADDRRDPRGGCTVPDPGGTGARRRRRARVRAVPWSGRLRSFALGTVRAAPRAVPHLRRRAPGLLAGPRPGRARGRHRLAPSARIAPDAGPRAAAPTGGTPGRRLHGVVGRPFGDERPGGPRGGRHQDRIGRTARSDAAGERPPAAR